MPAVYNGGEVRFQNTFSLRFAFWYAPLTHRVVEMSLLLTFLKQYHSLGWSLRWKTKPIPIATELLKIPATTFRDFSGVWCCLQVLLISSIIFPSHSKTSYYVKKLLIIKWMKNTYFPVYDIYLLTEHLIHFNNSYVYIVQVIDQQLD